MITENEKKMISDYIYAYATSSGCHQHTVPLETLLSSWNTSKAHLFKLFGEKLMISKDISFNKSIEELTEELSQEMYYGSQSSPLRIFYEAFWDCVNSLRLPWGHERQVGYFFSPSVLAENACKADVEIELPNGDVFKCQKGSRATKCVKKFADMLQIDGYEEFRIAHSQILNQKKLNGRLTLSIHPMDFMTMSDNNSGWESCMSWREEGGYRQGTVEMMNSDMVIVAYLESNTKFYPTHTEETWSNKKWRSLFIVAEENILSVKGYPYQNSYLVDEVFAVLRELAKENWKQEYQNTTFSFDHCCFDITDEYDHCWDFNIELEGYMYNDFGSTTHYALLMKKDASNADFFEEFRSHRFIDYSGRSQCMLCGGTLDFDGEDYANLLTCNHCVPTHVCECCGDRICNDHYNWVGDDMWCDYCYDEYAETDDITGEVYHYNDMCKFHFKDENGEINHDDCIYICHFDISSRDWSEHFLTDKQDILADHRFPYAWSDNVWVTKEDLTEKGLDLFSKCIY